MNSNERFLDIEDRLKELEAVILSKTIVIFDPITKRWLIR
jgi:hypothetical protein